MFQRTVRFIESIASIYTLLLLILASIIFPVYLFPLHGIGDIRLLDLYFSYKPDQVYTYLAALGEEGRCAYIYMALTSDLAFPVVYSLAFSVVLILLLKKMSLAASRFRYLCLFPFLIMIFDWFENLSLAFVTREFPQSFNRLINVASFFTSMKWILVLMTTLMLLTLVVLWAVTRIRGR